ncbi:MAG: hypothetical protein HRT89_18765, partial [Lentisphaeria bacterium]|nr:hypothetical protein [Lentisphaeria bacterium]
EIDVNGGTIIFTYGGGTWGTSGSYTLTHNGSEFELTHSTLTQDVDVTDALYILGTSEAFYDAQKATINNTFIGDFELDQETGSPVSSVANLIQKINFNYDFDDATIDVEYDATEAYIYNNNDTDLGIQTLTFSATANDIDSDEEDKISYTATQTPDDVFQAVIDITDINDNFDFNVGEIWKFTVGGTTENITLGLNYAALETSLNIAFADYTFTFANANDSLEVTNAGSTGFVIDDIALLEEKNSGSDVNSIGHYDTYIYDFNNETAYSGKTWVVTIDGTEVASGTVAPGVDGNLPIIDSALADILATLNDSYYTATLGGANNYVLTITGLNDAVIDLSVNVTGVAALIDLDDVQAEQILVRSFTYSDIPWEYKDTAASALQREAEGIVIADENLLSLGSNQWAVTSGSEYTIKTPYIIVYEKVLIADIGDINTYIATRTAELVIDVSAGVTDAFEAYITSVVADVEAEAGYVLVPVGVVDADDPFLEVVFSDAGLYVIEVGYVESTWYDQATTIYTQTQIATPYTVLTGLQPIYQNIPIIGNIIVGYTPIYETFYNYSWVTTTESLNTDSGPYNHEFTGVAAGSSYTLNVSVQQHALDQSNQTVVGKKIRIIDGPGKGAVADITDFIAYENGIKLNRMTVDPISGDWSIVTTESIYEIFVDDMTIKLGADYTAWSASLEDTYTVAITRLPGLNEDNVLAIDQVTLTYNGNEAFNKSIRIDHPLSYSVAASDTIDVTLEDTTVLTFDRIASSTEWTTDGEYYLIEETNGWIMGHNDVAQLIVVASAVLDEAGADTNTALDTADFSGGREYLQTSSSIDNGTKIVTVTAIQDEFIDGGDAQVFAPPEQRINVIRGPILIDGGVRLSADTSLSDPIMLPGEYNYPVTNGAKAVDGTAGNKDGVAADEITLADNDVVTRAELVTFLAQFPSDEYTILRDFLSDNSTTLNFATFVDLDVEYNDEETGSIVEGFDNRINLFPYELGFIDITSGDQVASWNILAVIGDRVILADDWPVGYDSAIDDYYYKPLNRNVSVTESEQVDTLNVNNSGSPANESGTLTDERLYGFGMGEELILEGEEIPGGIRYQNLETLNIELGSGDDALVIESTHEGITNVNSGDGNDSIDVKTISGHTRIEGEGDDDLITVSSNDSTVDQILGLLTIVGDNNGNDRLVIDDSGDTNDNTLDITGTTITGLDMPSVKEQLIIEIRAEEGQYELYIVGNEVPVLLDWDSTLADFKAAIVLLSGEPDANIDVQLLSGAIDEEIKEFQITFIGESAGIDIADFSTVIPETNPLAFGDEFTLTSDATAGTFLVSIDGGGSQTLNWDATEAELKAVVEILIADADLEVEVTLTTSPFNDLREYTINVNPVSITDTDQLDIAELTITHPGDIIVTDIDATTFEISVVDVDDQYVLLIKDSEGNITDQEILDWDADLTAVSDAFTALFALEFPEITIDSVAFTTGSAAATTKVYEITYTDAGTDTIDFTAIHVERLSALTLLETTSSSPRAFVTYVDQGSMDPGLNNVQVISIENTDDVTLEIYSPEGDYRGEVTFNVNSTIDEFWYEELSYLFNPNNTDERRLYYPETDNFSVYKVNNDFIFTFQGEYKDYVIDASHITAGTTTLSTRVQGINYYGIDDLHFELGIGNDTVNIESTESTDELSTMTINTNDGDDIVNVKTMGDQLNSQTLLEAINVNINTLDGDDTVNVGTDANELDGIHGELTIDLGSTGTNDDTLNLYDSGEVDVDSGTLDNNRLIGFGIGAPFGINYTNAELLNLDLGSNNDTLNIIDTHDTVSYISGYDGDDTINITTTSGTNYITGDADDDTYNITDTGGVNYIQGNEGADTFNIADTHGVSEIYGGHLGSAETALTGGDTFNVMGISGTLDMMGNEGDDLFVFGDRGTTTFAQTNGSFRIYGNTGDDDFDLYVNNTAGPDSDVDSVFYGNEGEDLIELHDHTGTAITLQGDEEDDNIVVYNNNAMTTIYGNLGEDRVYVDQTDAQVDIYTHDGIDDVYIKANNATVNIDTGIDDDFIKIGASAALNTRVLVVEDDGNLDLILATINVTGNDPFATPGTGDLLDINDAANDIDRHLELRWDRVTILDNAGLPDINYSDIETLDLYMGTGSDKLEIRSTIVSTVSRIYGNDGDETFNLGDDTDDGAANLDRLDQIAGELELYGEAHFDIINLNDSGTEAGSAANDGRITNTVIDGFGLGEFIRYFDFDLMNLTLGDEDESVEILGLFSSAMADTAIGLGGFENEKRTAFIQTGAGDDDVYVGHGDSTNTTLPTENNPATLAIPADDYTNIGVNEIYGAVFFDMGDGLFDTLNILEQNDTADNTNGRYLGAKTYQQITDTWNIESLADRDAAGHIIGLDDLLDTDPDYHELALDNVEELNIFLGTGNDVFKIEVSDVTEAGNLTNPAHEAIPGQDSTNIFAGGGDDRIVLFNEQYLLGSVDGEDGWDIIDYSLWTHGTLVDFRTGRAEGFNSGYNDALFDFSEAWGGSNDDFFFGDDFDNTFIGNDGNDVLYGFAGADTLDGGNDDDTLVGGTGTDHLIGGDGDDELNGGADADLLDDGLGSDTIDGGSGDDQYIMTSNLIAGDDTDSDQLSDSDGDDSLIFSAFEYGIELDLRDTEQWIILNEDAAKLFRLDGTFENISGTAFDDKLIGNYAINTLAGGPGNDEIFAIGNPGTSTQDTIISGTWIPDAITPESGDTATIFVPPVMPTVDTSDFRAFVMAAEPWDDATDKTTTDPDDIYIFTTASYAPDIIVMVDPDDDSKVIIAEFSEDELVKAVRVDSYAGIEIYGTSTEIDPSNPGTRITIVDDISSTGMSIEVTLRGQNNILDASTITHEITVNGSRYADIILTGSGNDTINADDGDDQVDAGAGNDLVNAGDGNDTIFGNDGNDEIRGDDGDDIIFGNDGDDRLVGGLGDDLIIGGLGNDIIIGDGDVVFNVDANRDILTNSAGLPDFTVTDIYEGGDDTLIGGSIGQSPSASGDDYIDGTNGDDLIIGDDAILYNGDNDDDGFW